MKNLAIVVLLVLSLGVVAAHDVGYKEKYTKTYYFHDDLNIVSKTTWVDYDNEKRYSTHDYRHGYSYRASKEYFDNKYSDVYHKKDARVFTLSDGGDIAHRDRYYNDRYHRYDYHNDGYYHDRGLRYQYEYVPHLREYDKRECYVSPPADKLFYVKC